MWLWRSFRLRGKQLFHDDGKSSEGLRECRVSEKRKTVLVAEERRKALTSHQTRMLANYSLFKKNIVVIPVLLVHQP